MTAAGLIQFWLQERGYSLTNIWCISGRLHWVRPPKGPGLYLWYEENNTYVIVSQNIDVYTDMTAKTYNISDPNLFEHLGKYFPYDNRNYKAAASD
jgi:hypothetical protein